MSPGLSIYDNVFNDETTNVKRLSCLHWEDVLQLKERSPLVLYLNPQSAYVSKHVLATQRKSRKLHAKARGSVDMQNQGGAPSHFLVVNSFAFKATSKLQDRIMMQFTG